MKALATPDDAAPRLTTAGVMARDMVAVPLQTTVDQAVELMDTGYFRHPPVWRTP